jgi:DNA-binding CsgD family transcriptional regulator
MTPPRATAKAPARWVLPEDGIIDELAVQIAAAGTRRVALTPTEQRLAAARILAAGGTPYRICRHLHISGRAAHALAEAITAGSRDDAA